MPHVAMVKTDSDVTVTISKVVRINDFQWCFKNTEKCNLDLKNKYIIQGVYK